MKRQLGLFRKNKDGSLSEPDPGTGYHRIDGITLKWAVYVLDNHLKMQNESPIVFGPATVPWGWITHLGMWEGEPNCSKCAIKLVDTVPFMCDMFVAREFFVTIHEKELTLTIQKPIVTRNT